VCCDGAFPAVDFLPCSGSKIVIEQGFCVPLEWHSFMKYTVKATLTGESGASMIAGQLVIDGDPTTWTLADGGVYSVSGGASEPTCVDVVLRNLVTGEQLTAPSLCFGVPEQLGPQVLTPDSFVFSGNCAGAPYTCELDGAVERWDPANCRTWPEGQDSTGGTEGPGGTGGPTSAGPTTGGGSSGAMTSTTSLTSSSGTGGATNPADDGLVEHGCACNGGGPGGALAGLLLLALRRRRLTTQASARTRR
jgi:hypothetical protein